MIQTLFGSLDEEQQPKKRGFFDKMKEAVTRTRDNLNERIDDMVAQIPYGKEIDRSVLDELEMTLERGEWDTNCTGNFETRRGTLSVMRATSNALADLMLRQTRSGTRNLLQGDECIAQERPATFSATVLRFDGTLYRMPRRAARD